MEGKKMEWNRTEWNKIEQNRTEWNRTDASCPVNEYNHLKVKEVVGGGRKDGSEPRQLYGHPSSSN